MVLEVKLSHYNIEKRFPSARTRRRSSLAFACCDNYGSYSSCKVFVQSLSMEPIAYFSRNRIFNIKKKNFF